ERRIARARHDLRPEAVDLGGGRGGARRRPGRAAALDRRAAARSRAALGAGPEAGGARRVDRARTIVLTDLQGRRAQPASLDPSGHAQAERRPVRWTKAQSARRILGPVRTRPARRAYEVADASCSSASRARAHPAETTFPFSSCNRSDPCASAVASSPRPVNRNTSARARWTVPRASRKSVESASATDSRASFSEDSGSPLRASTFARPA